MKSRFDSLAGTVMGHAILAMGIAIVVLALKMWRLEHAMENLSEQIQQPPRVVYPAATVPPASVPNGKPNVFRLLDSNQAGESEAATPLGVPWGVEKAMMLEGAQSQQEFELRQGTTIQGEAKLLSPSTLDDLPDAAPIELTPNSPR